MTGTGELSWYALRVMSRYEDMVKKYLIYRGHKAYTKLEKKFGRWTNGQRPEKEFVAAPGYVFLGIDGNPWDLVHKCHLIRSVVSVNGRPALLHPQALASFLNMPDDNLPDHFRFFREPPFAIGDMVCIDSPSFEGFELRVKDIQRNEAIFDLVMFNSVSTEVRFPVDMCYRAA